MRNVEDGSAVTAPSTDIGQPFGIVFLGEVFTAENAVSAVALGRPWSADGMSAFLGVELGVMATCLERLAR